MPDPASDDAPIANPTWYGNISGFFDDGEIQCMAAQGIDLASYGGVRKHATDIYEQTRVGNMPMGGTAWTAGRVRTFLNWIATGFPLGVAPPPPPTPVPTPTPAPDPIVAHPTYSADISHFFRPQDIACMSGFGVDLASYAGVKAMAAQIYARTKSGNMPQGGPAWSANRVQTFANWIADGYPLGAAAPQAMTAEMLTAAAAPGVRLRKNVNALSPAEIDLLKTAFRGIMALDPTSPQSPLDSNSYFVLAALHGVPNAYCMHHVDGYNPWHRVYMKAFEDALRSVPGCAEVTLPYWDITEPVPALLYEPPFDSYTLPIEIAAASNSYPQGYQTQRFDAATIRTNLLKVPSVPSDIADALPAAKWGAYKNGGGFQQYIIEGHDDGHNSCGPTMANQDVAAYDPIFWFFHCNWDRLWQSWQVLAGATTLPGFVATLDGNTDWLPLALDPYPTPGSDTIVWPDIAYDKLAGGEVVAMERKAGSTDAAMAFTVEPSRVSLRVKDIDRMNIPGTFVVNLLADGEPIARRAFFQPTVPRGCATCRKQALISLDFRLDQSLIVGRKLSIAIEVPSLGEGAAGNFPLAEAGNPTINVRMLLSPE